MRGLRTCYRNIACAAFVLLTACEPYQDTSSGDDLATEYRFKGIESRIEALEKKNIDELMRSNRFSYFKNSTKGEGFGFVDTDLGALAFTLQDITPSGPGSKVTMNVGNPTGATITSLKVKGGWGSLDKDGNPKSDEDEHEWEATIRTPLPPGTWQDISFVIDGGKPSDIGWFSVGDASVGSITLTRR